MTGRGEDLKGEKLGIGDGENKKGYFGEYRDDEKGILSTKNRWKSG